MKKVFALKKSFAPPNIFALKREVRTVAKWKSKKKHELRVIGWCYIFSFISSTTLHHVVALSNLQIQKQVNFSKAKTNLSRMHSKLIDLKQLSTFVDFSCHSFWFKSSANAKGFPLVLYLLNKSVVKAKAKTTVRKSYLSVYKLF